MTLGWGLRRNDLSVAGRRMPHPVRLAHRPSEGGGLDRRKTSGVSKGVTPRVLPEYYPYDSWVGSPTQRPIGRRTSHAPPSASSPPPFRGRRARQKKNLGDFQRGHTPCST